MHEIYLTYVDKEITSSSPFSGWALIYIWASNGEIGSAWWALIFEDNFLSIFNWEHTFIAILHYPKWSQNSLMAINSNVYQAYTNPAFVKK